MKIRKWFLRHCLSLLNEVPLPPSFSIIKWNRRICDLFVLKIGSILKRIPCLALRVMEFCKKKHL